MTGFQTVLAFSFPGGWELIVVLVVMVGFVLLTRLFGAWMLRINEVIDLLRSIKEILKKKDGTT
ncbi:MAG: hypothetical protein RJQ14_18980 [Marinoscillum sp.]